MTQRDVRRSVFTPVGSSPSEPTTSVPDESLDETAHGSMSTPLISWNRALANLDMESLTPRSQAIQILIAEDKIDGWSYQEIAGKLGQPASWVAERLNDLRAEILLNSGHFLPLSQNDWDALRGSVQEHGVRVPVLVGEHQLIDGRHRWLISEELGLTDIPAVFVFGLTAAQEHDLAVSVNMARRHLNRKQKRLVIRAELQRDWSRSSRQVAAVCGVTQPTVEDVRVEMRMEAEQKEREASAEPVFVPPPKETEVRVDSSGRVQQAYVATRGRPPAPVEAKEQALGYVVCSHGEVHQLLMVGSEYQLRVSRD